MNTKADLYQVLDVGRDASEREIKKAFHRLLRQNPPEQKPKEYQQLREAYDILSDAVARQEYESRSAFGDEIEVLQEQAEELLAEEDPDYAEAERLLKKAIVLGPKIGMLRNMLGRCYLDTEQAGRALRQFEKAVQINPNNEAYLLNKGQALEKLKRYAEAEALYREVWARDSEDYAAPRALASLLHTMGRAAAAQQVLDEAIEADGKIDFQDFFCIYDKVHLYLVEGEHAQLRAQLAIIVRVAKVEADRRFAGFMLSRTAAALLEVKVFDLADDFMKAARQLDPNDEAIQDLATATREAAAMHRNTVAILKGDSFHPVVQEIVRNEAALYLGHLEPEAYRENMMEVAEILDTLLDVDPEGPEIKQAVRRVQSDFPQVFALSPDLFENILRFSAPTQFRKPCPYCTEKVTASKGAHRLGQCPHCDRAILLAGDHFERTTASSTTDSGIPGWVWVAGFVFVLWLLGAC